jgi:hypothetical protein
MNKAQIAAVERHDLIAKLLRDALLKDLDALQDVEDKVDPADMEIVFTPDMIPQEPLLRYSEEW